MKRNGVLSRQSTTRPAVQRSKGPLPNAATRPSAPGKLVTHCATGSSSRFRAPSLPPGSVEAERQPATPRIPAGITHADTAGIATIGDHAIGTEPVEMIGDVGMGRGSGEERNQQQAGISLAPERYLRGEPRLAAPLIQGNPC